MLFFSFCVKSENRFIQVECLNKRPMIKTIFQQYEMLKYERNCMEKKIKRYNYYLCNIRIES